MSRSSVTSTDPVLPEIFTRAQARQAGLSERQIDYRLASGAWVRQRRGVFSIPGALPEWASGPARRDITALNSLRAAAFTIRDRGLAISHQSACLPYGLPGPLGGWGLPTFSGNDGPTRNRRAVRVFVAPLARGEVTKSPSGLLVTVPVRTVADCLRTLRPADALAVADAAVRRGLTVAAIRRALAAQRGWPGVVRARILLDLVDPRRESPLESWSAWGYHEAAVPQPDWQVDIHTVDGRFCGRVDSWWRCGLAGEADGRAKYALAAAERGGADAERLALVLAAEREREMWIRRTGAELLRWGTRDVRGPGRVDFATHVVRRLAEVRQHAHFTGHAVAAPLMLPEPTLNGPLDAANVWVPGA